MALILIKPILIKVTGKISHILTISCDLQFVLVKQSSKHCWSSRPSASTGEPNLQSPLVNRSISFYHSTNPAISASRLVYQFQIVNYNSCLLADMFSPVGCQFRSSNLAIPAGQLVYKFRNQSSPAKIFQHFRTYDRMTQPTTKKGIKESSQLYLLQCLQLVGGKIPKPRCRRDKRDQEQFLRGKSKIYYTQNSTNITILDEFR